jgi:16S rRNA processing protein RimM
MTDQTRKTPQFLLLGQVLRPHGVRGEVRVQVLTDYPERISELKTVFLGNDPAQPTATPYEVETARLHQDYVLLKFKNIADRNAADLLRDQYVMIDLPNAVPLEDDEFYLYELIDLTVQTAQGEVLGTIREVFETGANDVYIVDSDRYGELLIPAHDETIVEIDLEAGIVTVQLPEGLLPD